MMERQIARIQAEQEIRRVQTDVLINPPQSKDTLRMVEEHVGRLTLEIGEKVTVRRNIIVAPDPGASAQFAKLTGG